ncbi:hypothetical protein STEG23_004673, partial [Scotinomys teguina]
MMLEKYELYILMHRQQKNLVTLIYCVCVRVYIPECGDLTQLKAFMLITVERAALEPGSPLTSAKLALLGIGEGRLCQWGLEKVFIAFHTGLVLEEVL